MRVIVAGSTQWDDADAIHRELVELSSDSVVIHGDAPGADQIGGEIARQIGLSVEPIAKNSKDYRRYRRGAWKSLNERMIQSGVELVLAFHPAIDKSKGTRHLVALANEMEIKVKIIES